MKQIESYSFGKMVVDGKSYTADLIIYPDRVDDSWWRKQGHLLQIEDLREILEAEPEILIIGTGAAGIMRVPSALRKQLEEKNIQLYIERTGKAVEIFNTLDKSKKVVAAFHLTC